MASLYTKLKVFKILKIWKSYRKKIRSVLTMLASFFFQSLLSWSISRGDFIAESRISGLWDGPTSPTVLRMPVPAHCSEKSFDRLSLSTNYIPFWGIQLFCIQTHHLCDLWLLSWMCTNLLCLICVFNEEKTITLKYKGC